MLQDLPISLLDPVTVIVVLLIGFLFLDFRNYAQNMLPWVNDEDFLDFGYHTAELRFISSGRALVRAGLEKWPAFNIVGDNGFHTVLSPRYATEIRSHPGLSFGAVMEHDFHAYVRGFEPFKLDTGIAENAVRTQLTQRLESHTIHARTTILQLVAQLSSKVFLGAQICRNPHWLEITINYTVDSFQAAQDLYRWPKSTRRLAAHILPSYRKVYAELEEARRIINPILKQRKAEKQATSQRGEAPSQYLDALQWMEDCAKGQRFDMAVS
ncbi:hypothetical protein BJX62DRAFT_241441 [Aspergillus germanicus]